jgi:very-short-patch-repair endonuclease
MQKQIGKYICKICGKEEKYILRHLKNHHKEYNTKTLKEYYDLYYKQKEEGICKSCKHPTRFTGQIKTGYAQFCTKKCCALINSKRRIGVPLSDESKKKIKIARIKYFKTKKGKRFRKKLSLSRKGSKNPIHRRDLEKWKRACIEKSKLLKERIKNGTFTPPITNTWANSKTKLYLTKDRWFRSTWEAAFFILNSKLEYEKIRIQYVSENNINKNYIVDFVDVEGKILYEVKPDCYKDSINFKLKQAAANKWCIENGYTYVVINNDYFKANAKRINYKKFPQILKGMKQFL